MKLHRLGGALKRVTVDAMAAKTEWGDSVSWAVVDAQTNADSMVPSDVGLRLDSLPLDTAARGFDDGDVVVQLKQTMVAMLRRRFPREAMSRLLDVFGKPDKIVMLPVAAAVVQFGASHSGTGGDAGLVADRRQQQEEEDIEVAAATAAAAAAAAAELLGEANMTMLGEANMTMLGEANMTMRRSGGGCYDLNDPNADHTEEAIVRERRGDMAGAIDSFRAATRSRPDAPAAWSNLATALRDKANPSRDIATHDEAVRCEARAAELTGAKSRANVLNRLQQSDEGLINADELIAPALDDDYDIYRAIVDAAARDVA
jgi:hypothetical protein